MTPRRHCEHGTGLIGSAAGTTVFLLFLLFAVQLITNLYATSTVSAAGYDAARFVASRQVDHRNPDAVAHAKLQAEEQLRALLGGMGRQADLSWEVTGSSVRLTIHVRAPGILPSAMDGGAGRRVIDRTFAVRIEQQR